ncbi:ABC transporter permease [Tellurirhabdus rosea]|uniref:ABC transporter permease n=1 Tax=Tellurirhabdus rosea TaxID=2674997 RepID=UPI002258ACC3|nr:ABC transporter permease [Tellurirhabdus rosea]
MLTNYLKIAFRSLWRQKAYSSINIVGLAVGIASCLLLFLYLSHELSYDNFHAKGDRIVRATMEYSMDGQVGKVAQTGTKLLPDFVRNFPEIETGVRLFRGSHVVRYGDRQFTENRFVYADSTFFSIFSFRLLKGNPAQALTGVNQIVLSESTARKYFGAESPVGKVLNVNTGGGVENYTVTGVVEDAPSNSQIKYDLLASFSSFGPARTIQWWSANYATYFLLKNAASLPGLQAKIPAHMRNQSAETEMTGKNYLTFNLEPLRRVHLHSDVEGIFEPNGDLTYIYIFGSIAVLILLIACVNYVNLATARAVERAQEVGVRKVMGALPVQLFGQFIGESLLVTATALLIGLGLGYVLLPLFNELSDRTFSFAAWLKPQNMLVLLGLGLFVALTAGSYPALVLTRFQPVRVLKGHVGTSGAGYFRRTLIVVQFSITAFLLISTLVVQTQLSYIQSKKLGYDKDQILVLEADGALARKMKAVKNELRRDAGIQAVSLANETPAFVQGGFSMHRADQPDEQYKMVAGLPIDEDFVKTTGLKIIAGRDLNENDLQLATKDTLRYLHFILNESAVKEMGWRSPQEAIGQKMDMGKQRPGEVVAVVEDFHFASLRQTIKPLVLLPEVDFNRTVLVRLAGGDVAATLQSIEATWRTLAPNLPFEYQFLDEQFNRLYHAEARTGRIFTVFASLSILLACLGLFGLSAYTTARRTREIGIRKVMGASVASLVGLLAKDFLLLVLVGLLIASPLAWWAMKTWLQDFAYRVDMPWWTFGLAGVLAVAFLTVSFQSVKAALMNPVKSLRTE